jgi:hypothetical protein
MANSNFIVQNGLQVGPLTIDATSGNITTTGNITASGSAPAVFTSINNTPIGNATPSTGAFTTLGATAATTLNTVTAASYQGVIGNVTPAAAVHTTITTGGLQSVAIGNVTPGTGAFTTGTFNTATTGGLQSVAIGNVTPGTGAFTTLSASGITQLTNSTDASSTNTGALQITGGAGILGNLWVGGNIYAANIVATTQNILVIQDPLVYLQATNPYGQYNYDIGIYSDYSAPGYRHTGLARQNNANTWVFFSNVASEPGATSVNWNDVGIAYDSVKAGSLTLANTVGTVLTVSGNTSITSTLYAQGIYDSSNRVLSTSSGAGNLSISGTAVTLPATGPGAVSTGSGSAIPVITTDAYGRIASISTSGLTAVTNLSSTGAGNISVSAATGSSSITLPATGPGAASVGSSTAIPVITTDAYGRVSATSTAAVVAPAGTLSGGTLNSGVTASSLTSVGTLTGLTVSGTVAPNANASVALGGTSTYWGSAYINSLTATGITVNSGKLLPGANASIDIGSTTAWFNNIYGTASHALYADLAENYLADRTYHAGTVLMFGGTAELTMADADTTRVAGVVSTNPAHLMNGALQGAYVTQLALMGRVPCQIIGPVAKGDLLVSAGWGYAKTNNTPAVGTIIGKALEDFPSQAKGVIEVVVGRV